MSETQAAATRGDSSLECRLPRWAGGLIGELQAVDARACAVAAGLGAAELNGQPHPGAWGIGQCLEHLSITNKIYCASISDALEGQPRGRVEELRIGSMSQWFIRRYIAPNPDGRSKTLAKLVPPGEIASDVLAAFLATNAAVRELIVRAGGFDVNRIRFKNPFVPLLRFTVGTGLEIVAKHESRHLLQAERVREARESPR